MYILYDMHAWNMMRIASDLESETAKTRCAAFFVSWLRQSTSLGNRKAGSTAGYTGAENCRKWKSQPD